MTWQLWIVVGFEVTVLLAHLFGPPPNLEPPKAPLAYKLSHCVVVVILITLIIWGAS